MLYIVLYYHIDIIMDIYIYGYHISFIDIIRKIWWFPEMGVPQKRRMVYFMENP